MKQNANVRAACLRFAENVEPVRLTADSVQRIATEVVETHSFPVRVLASVTTGKSNYVEILLQIEGADGQSVAEIGVFRDVGIEDLRQRIADQIRRHVSSREKR